MENQQMGMTPQAAAPAMGPDQMAIFDQMRQEISPQEFTSEMLAGGSQIDPQAVAEFTQALEGLNMPPEVLDALNDMVDAILAEPESYAEMRQEFITEGVPEDFLPEQFDPEFFAALNMAVDQMVGEPSGVQAFANGGIAELKPIAKAIASYGRNGDTMLAHITPAEARMLRRRGGSGTINPHTGLPEFFLKKLFKAVGSVFKSVGNAVKSVFKSVVGAVKKFASSTVGRIITTVALGFFLGPAAASLLGVTSAAGVAAVSGFVGSAGATLAGGGNLKDALKAGAVGGLTAGAGAGIMGGSAAFAANSASTAGMTAGEAFNAQVGKFTNMFTPSAAPTGIDATAAEGSLAKANTALAEGAAPVPTGQTAPDTLGQGTSAAQAGQAGQAGAFRGVPTVSESIGKIGQGFGMGEGPANFADIKQGVGDLFAPSGATQAEINAQASALMKQNPGMTWADASRQATASMTPGIFRTYAPVAAAGLGIMSMTGGFTPQPIEPGPITESLQKPAAQRMREEGVQRENYVQDMPGVKYDQYGEPIYGESRPLPTYVAQDFAKPTDTTYGRPPPSSMYVPPPGSLTNSAGGVYQPYNNSNMYAGAFPSLYPGMGQNMPPRRYAAEGGIAALGSGGYPRRTGQISGPGTEKSDSIPAMLSDGEFVMTAKAVRGAGKGDRRAGAKRMYKLMHQLEKNSERG
jgi:hypothetical protein